MKQFYIFISSLIICFGFVNGYGQVNPITPQSLPYSQNFNGVTTFPSGWRGLEYSSATIDYPLTQANDYSSLQNRTCSGSSFVNNFTTGHIGFYNGVFGFLSSGSITGGICLAINTTTQENIQVTYKIQTQRNLTSGIRDCFVGLQYRIGTSGDFTNLDNTEYQRATTANSSANCTAISPQNISIVLPTECNNQPIVQIRWAQRETGSGSRAGFSIDDVVVSANTICTPNHGISGITPSSGPSGTWVDVSGINFIQSEIVSPNVKYGTYTFSNSEIQYVSSSKIRVKIPSNQGNKKISITQSTCEVSTTTNFTMNSDNGNCYSALTDLMISEVYDNSSGNLTYVEIYNGTNAAVNLATLRYAIVFKYNGNPITESSTGVIQLSGSIASHSTLIYGVRDNGSNSNTCSPSSVSFSNFGGVNGDDEILLYKNFISTSSAGTLIDYAPNKKAAAIGGSSATGYGTSNGFTQRRLVTASVIPSATYIASDWEFVSPDCSDLGNFTYSNNSSFITISSQPSDLNCLSGSLTFTVSATGVLTPTTNSQSYVWKFIDTEKMTTWANVSDINNSPYSYNVTPSAANANTITLTGDIASLRNIQLYVEMRTGGTNECKMNSNVARYTYDSRNIYRTKSSGNYTNASIWEMSNDALTWVNACVAPNRLNSEEVRIGHTGIILDMAQDVNKLWVQSAGSLEISTNRQLSVSGNVSGAEYIIDGTVTDRSNISNGVLFNNGAKWQMGPNGTLIKTNAGSVSRYRDDYEGGISNIPATANWVYNNNGDGSVNTVAAGMYYPNLYFINSQSGMYSWNTGVTALTGAQPCIVKGNLNIGNSIAGLPADVGNVTVHNNLTGTGSNMLQVLGNLIIKSGSLLTTLPNTTSTSVHGSGINIQGNLTVNGNLSFSNSDALLLLSGSNNQLLGGSGIYGIYRLEVNKTANRVTTEVPVSIYTNLALTSGIIETTGSGEVILMNNLTTISRAASTSNNFVQGRLRIPVNGSNTLSFPVGHSGYTYDAYQPLTFIPVGTTNNADYFTASFTPSLPANGLLLGPNLMGLNKHGYWAFDRNTGGTTNGKVSLQYSVVPATGGHWYDPNATSPNDYLDPASGSAVLIAKRENGPSFAPWNFTYYGTLLPNTYTAYGSAATIETEVVNSFSLFSFGISGGSVLPVRLVSFNVVNNNKTSYLNWELADVHTLAYSQVEYSLNGSSFMSLGTVNAVAGKLQYNYSHGPLAAGVYYYRVLFVEKDGSKTYSATRTVTIGDVLNTQIIGLSQTAIQGAGSLNIQILLRESANVFARITNNSGQVIHQTEQTLPKGNVQMALRLPSLPAGVYYVHVVADGETKTLRFLSTN